MPPIAFEFDIPARTSPDLERARNALDEWIPRSGLVRSEAGLRQLRSWDMALGAASVYPDATGPDLDLLCKWFCLAFLFDDQVDAEEADRPALVAEFAREMLTIPLRPPGTPPDLPCPITVVWAEVWPGLAEGMSITWQDRFAANWGRFLAAHAHEISLTARKIPLDLNSYVRLRRVSVGIQHSLDASERSARFEIPPEAMAHPLMREIRLAGVDVIAFMNDIHSLERERRRGDDHNLVTVLSRQADISAEAAVKEAVRMVEARLSDLKELEARIHDMCRELRLTPAKREDVQRGVEAVRRWIRGNHDWGLRTGRYKNEGSRTGFTRYVDDLLESS
jgi:hypothetical protein